ncbi:MAG: 5'-nucleotidase C-terminal domain-containing protein [Paludibacteraceae bacterium]|nr:5'-nucleotidase C-terminal domain-containing protein [Paludibacteraceae bacterium]
MINTLRSLHLAWIAILVLLLLGCRQQTADHVRILATSDTHGMFYPMNYATLETNKGSLAQVATVVNERRDANTLLVEVGDVTQGNAVEQFQKGEHCPMVVAMNAIGYDLWVAGNHEFNFGMDYLHHLIDDCHATLLSGNVYSPEGKQLGQDYVIRNMDGVKVGIIGMVTPNIVNWDKVNLEGWTVTNPVEETVRLAKQLRSKVDILIAAEHMGMDNEYGVPGSGARDLAMSCPELDLIIAAHAHVSHIDSIVNGVLIVANRGNCQTMVQVDFVKVNPETVAAPLLSRNGQWQIVPELIFPGDYAPDSALVEQLMPYHTRAMDDARLVIGEVVGADLIGESAHPGVMDAFLQDHPWPDLIAAAMKYYSGADVVASFIVPTSATITQGDITKADCSVIYKYSNTMYLMRATGRQLRKYMEWSAGYFQTYQPGQPLRFNDRFASYNFDMFTGVDYVIDVTKPVGQRIQNLVWSQTKIPVADTDTFTLAVSNYRANTHLRHEGVILSDEDGMPEVLEVDMCGQIGNVRDLIARYIQDVLGGKLTPECDNNWHLVGLPADFIVQPTSHR